MAVSAEETRRQRELRWTGAVLLVALLIGLAFVVLRFLIAFFDNGIAHRGWYVTGQGFTSVLWALGWFACAFVFGFLFGVPRTPKQSTGSAGPTPSNAGTSQKDRDKAKVTPYQLAVNTNLEEISDWLTKILVGAGLTQLTKVPTLVAKAADYMVKGGCGAGCESFAASIVVFFSAIGFLSGYVLTRMFFSGAFRRSDRDARDDLQDVVKVIENAPEIGEERQIDHTVRQTAQKSTLVPITDALTETEARALAKAANLVGDSSRALIAAGVALAKNPSDPNSQLEYAAALYKTNTQPEIVLRELQKAHDLIPRDMGQDAKQAIYNSIVYLALYQPEPQGFESAIQYGTEYLAMDSRPGRSILTNLACAYGQQYSYLKRSEAAESDKKAAAQASIDLVRRAIKNYPASQERLHELATAANTPDNDLSDVAADYQELRQLLGMQ